MKLLEEKLADDARVDFSIKSIPHILMDEDYLPEVEDRMFICSDDEKTWLELTNFVYEESNNIIKLYLGDITDAENLHPIRKDAIEIFDPETAFVFIRGVIGFWEDNFLDSRFSGYAKASPDRHGNDKTKDINSKLIQAIQAGYEAVFYHFGFDNFTLSSSNASIGDPEELLKFQQDLQQQYAKEAKKIGRFVSPEEIARRKNQETQRLTAYYPNPIYLGNIAKYIRHKDMSYDDHIEKCITELTMEQYSTNCDKKYITKSPDIIFDQRDEYSLIANTTYPDDPCILCEEDPLDYERIRAYAFRGDKRPIDEIYKKGGFQHNADEKELEKESAWKFKTLGKDLVVPFEHYSPYVCTSSIFGIASHYGQGHEKKPYTIYTVFADGGIKVPGTINMLAVPLSIDWDNVVGGRNALNFFNFHKQPHLIGPIYLKDELAKNEKRNFWKILQIMGGKSQCQNLKANLELSKACVNLLRNDNKENEANVRKNSAHFMRTSDACTLIIQSIIDLESRTHRR